MVFKEFHICTFMGQNLGPVWVKNGKKSYFQASTLTPKTVFPEKKVLNSHNLLTYPVN